MTALASLRVLDLTRYIPGPYATLLLADLGADVIKVEPPAGDPTRGLPPAVGEESAAHAALNRGKKSIVVDIRTEGGAAVVRKLAASVDVLVESFRPGVLARNGLGPEPLLAANPRLVYASISSYGQDGPYRDRAGHDIDYAALGGFLGSNRDAAGGPVIPTTQVADTTAGLLTAFAVLAALAAREKTGRGQYVDVSLLRATLALMSLPLARAHGGPADELTGVHPCYSVYRCRDGRALAVGALEPKFWEGLCAALGRPDLVGRQWATGERRSEAGAELAEIFATRDRDDWVKALAPHDVCVEPVLLLEEVEAHPAVAPSMMDAPVGTARMRTVVPPVRFSATPAGPPGRPPELGEHTDDVLARAGFTPSEIDRMRAQGVVA